MCFNLLIVVDCYYFVALGGLIAFIVSDTFLVHSLLSDGADYPPTHTHTQLNIKKKQHFVLPDVPL